MARRSARRWAVRTLASRSTGPPIRGRRRFRSRILRRGLKVDPSAGCALPSDDKDLPFTNIALADDAITFGFFKDQASAEGSDPGGAGAFGDTDAYSNASALLGDGYDITGAVDLGPILDEFVDSPSVPDAILGGSPEDLIMGFIADKLSTVAAGIRYEDGYSIQRYSLGISQSDDAAQEST